jgi:hypothetical protein
VTTLKTVVGERKLESVAFGELCSAIRIARGLLAPDDEHRMTEVASHHLCELRQREGEIACSTAEIQSKGIGPQKPDLEASSR